MEQYDYDMAFGVYHTGQQMAEFLLRLYNNGYILGIVDRGFQILAALPPVFSYTNSYRSCVNEIYGGKGSHFALAVIFQL